MMGFHGSYPAPDVEFLLKQINIESTNIEDKEKLIQSGNKHYSEMITKESLPTDRYMSLFRQSVISDGHTMAKDIYRMAAHINQIKESGEITLVSLARAGTPVGVLVKRVLEEAFGANTAHYSVSIIRDRGIDDVALDEILARGHASESIVFIDGWTGKGVISRELAKSVTEFNQSRDVDIDTGLYVLNDLAGTAAWCSSAEDYLIPSSILNATVSGLISRSILNSDCIGENEFHGCLYYSEFEAYDLSEWFVEQILSSIPAVWMNMSTVKLIGKEESEFQYQEDEFEKAERAIESADFMAEMQARFEINDINLIKPGIGESTRVMLRRVPDLLVVKDRSTANVKHLLVLAEEKNIEVIEDNELLYNAVAIIKEVD